MPPLSHSYCRPGRLLEDSPQDTCKEPPTNDIYPHSKRMCPLPGTCKASQSGGLALRQQPQAPTSVSSPGLPTQQWGWSPHWPQHTSGVPTLTPLLIQGGTVSSHEDPGQVPTHPAQLSSWLAALPLEWGDHWNTCDSFGWHRCPEVGLRYPSMWHGQSPCPDYPAASLRFTWV